MAALTLLWGFLSPLNLLVFFLVLLSILAIVLLFLGSGFDDTSSSSISEKNINVNLSPRCLYPETFMIDSLIDYLAILLWPVIWEFTIGFRIIEVYPFTFIGLIWPMVLGFMDLYLARDKIARSSATSGAKEGCGFDEDFLGGHNGKGGSSRKGGSTLCFGNVQVDASAVITIAFAMGALLLSLHDKATSAISAPMIMFALLFTIIFVIPSNDIHLKPSSKLYLFSTQRVFLNFAIGFVIAGISVNLSSILHHHDFYSYKQLLVDPKSHNNGIRRQGSRQKRLSSTPTTSYVAHPPPMRTSNSAAAATAAAADAIAGGKLGL